MKLYCGFTCCKNNKRVSKGYICSLKETHWYSHWSSNKPEVHKAICANYVVRYDHAFAEEMI